MRHNVESTDCRQYAISRRGIVGLSSLTFCGIYQPFSLSYKTSLSPLHCSLILPFYAFNIPGALVCSSTLYTDGRWIPALKRGKVYAYRCIGCNKIESIDRINPEKWPLYESCASISSEGLLLTYIGICAFRQVRLYETHPIVAEYNGQWSRSFTLQHDLCHAEKWHKNLFGWRRAEISGKGILTDLTWVAARDGESCIPPTDRNPDLPFQLRTFPCRFETW